MASIDLRFVDNEVRIRTIIRASWHRFLAILTGMCKDFVDIFVPDSVVNLFLAPPPVPPPPLAEKATIRVAPGNELKDVLRNGVLNKRVVMMEGPPGVGKTYTALEVLRDLTSRKVIRGFVYFACTKALAPDQVWQPELVMTTDAEGRLKTEQNPPEWQKLLGNNFAPLMTATEAELLELDKLENSVVIFADEASRASQVMLDSILTPMESRVVTINGRQVIAPGLLWILGGNPAGMDQTATGYSPPLMSRFDIQVTLTNPDLATLVFYIDIAIAGTVADCGGMRPSYELTMMAAGICQLLGGWPLTRPCYAEAPPQVLKLVERAVEIDAYLKNKLIEIGMLTKYPPDARKPAKWVINAIIEAYNRQRAAGKLHGKVTADDFVKWSVLSLSPGVRRSFAPGVKPQLQRQLDELIATITAHVFSSPQLSELILNSGGTATAAQNVVASIVRRDHREKVLPLVEQALEDYRRKLKASGVPVAEQHFSHFVETLTRLPQALTALPPKCYASKIAERARTKQWLVGSRGVLFSKWDRELLQALAQTSCHLHRLGRLVVEMSQRPLALTEWVRQSTQPFPLAAEFEPELLRFARRSPALTERLPEASQVVQVLLEPSVKCTEMAVENARKCIDQQGWEKLDLAALCRLLRAVRRAAEKRFAARFVSLDLRLKNL